MNNLIDNSVKLINNNNAFTQLLFVMALSFNITALFFLISKVSWHTAAHYHGYVIFNSMISDLMANPYLFSTILLSLFNILVVSFIAYLIAVEYKLIKEYLSTKKNQLV